MMFLMGPFAALSLFLQYHCDAYDQPWVLNLFALNLVTLWMQLWFHFKPSTIPLFHLILKTSLFLTGLRFYFLLSTRSSLDLYTSELYTTASMVYAIILQQLHFFNHHLD